MYVCIDVYIYIYIYIYIHLGMSGEHRSDMFLAVLFNRFSVFEVAMLGPGGISQKFRLQ